MSKKARSVSPPLFRSKVDDDWCLKDPRKRVKDDGMGVVWWLCHEGANAWWDLSEAYSIEFVVSAEPDGEGYRAYIGDEGYFDPQLTVYEHGTEKHIKYSLFVAMEKQLLEVADHGDTVYISINVLEYK